MAAAKKQVSQITKEQRIRNAAKAGERAGLATKQAGSKLAERVGIVTLSVAGTVAVGAGIAYAMSRGFFRTLRR